MQKLRKFAIVVATFLFGVTASAQERGEPSIRMESGAGDSPLADWLPGDGARRVTERSFWSSAEYMQAWMRGMDLPTLVTTSTAGTGKSVAGVIGQPGTSVLYQGPVNNNSRSGFRIAGGAAIDPELRFGIEAGYIFLGSLSTSSSFNSNENAILARPFTDSSTKAASVVLVAFPGSSTGNVNISARSGNFHSVNLDLSEKAYDNGSFRTSSLIGYRFYRYEEALLMEQSLTPSVGSTLPFAVGTLVSTTDRFAVTNEFHGIDLGFRSEFLMGNLSLEVLTKVAAGRLFRTLTVAGEQTVSVPGGGTTTSAGGLYALSSNIGTRRTGDWTVIPELGTTLNWHVRPNLTLRVGYSMLYLSAISRISDQVDTTLNTTLFPNSGVTASGANRPAFRDVHSDSWIQSVTLGFEYRF